MYDWVNAIRCQPVIHKNRQAVNTVSKQIIQYRADYVEGQGKNCRHNPHKQRDGKDPVGQHTVNCHAAAMFFTFLGFLQASVADTFNEIIPHICQGCIAVHTGFCFHLHNGVFDQLLLVFTQLQHFCKCLLPFDQLCCAKSAGNGHLLGMVFNNMTYCVNAAVNGAVRAKVLDPGFCTLLCR